MTQQQDPNWWLSWIVPAIAAGTALVAFLKRFFSYVTREEFMSVMNARHQENQVAIASINTKLDSGARDRNEMRKDIGKVAEDVAYLRGRDQ